MPVIAFSKWQQTLCAAALLMFCASCDRDVNAIPSPASSAPLSATPEIFATTPSVSASVAPEQTCAEELGTAAARALVGLCLEVSPATRPPCNAENACALIESEIRRGCDLLGAKAPDGCGRIHSP